jgi:hypothetical protein
MLELKTLGVEYIVVHGAKSREYYRDFFRPERIANTLQPVYHLEDDTIYALPVRSLAHVISPSEMIRADPVVHPDALQPFVSAIDDPARPLLTMNWSDPSHFSVSGAMPGGNIVAVQVTANGGWRATQDGRPLAIDTDRLGFMVLRPRPSSASRIEFSYIGTKEQRIMAGVSGLTWIAAILLLFRRKAAPQSGKAKHAMA